MQTQGHKKWYANAGFRSFESEKTQNRRVKNSSNQFAEEVIPKLSLKHESVCPRCANFCRPEHSLGLFEWQAFVEKIFSLKRPTAKGWQGLEN
jgi:hypothetical protein